MYVVKRVVEKVSMYVRKKVSKKERVIREMIIIGINYNYCCYVIVVLEIKIIIYIIYSVLYYIIGKIIL